MDLDLVRTRYPAQEREGDAAWAHVSGWAQLSGHRQNISCIVPTLDQAPILATMLPELSDVLTECGYPWEVVIVDAGSRDTTEALLRAWCQFDGFRALMLREEIGRTSAITIGLQEARGDAVVLLDPASEHPLSLLRQMVILWEGGADVTCAVR